MAEAPTVEPFGDAALLVSVTSDANAAAAVIEALRERQPAIGRPTPAHTTILVPFDPLNLAIDEAAALVERALRDAAAPLAVEPDMAAVEVPVRYGGLDGPDLEVVAETHALRPLDVIDLHSSARYRVLFLGFAPGFAYLGGLPEALVTARRASPRERVPAGSVGIAGEQTGVYPLAMPGGWQLIGRTDTQLFDPSRDPPALLRPGMTVRFVPLR